MGGGMIILVNLVVELRSLVPGIGKGMISLLETMNYVVLFEMKWIMKSYQQLIQKI